MNLPRTIAVDFDGTIVTNDFPNIGDPVPLALETLLELQDHNVQLYLWTVRSGQHLQEAIKYCADNNLIFKGTNKNPTQSSWSKSPKLYCQMYIDDSAFGCPLIKIDNEKPCVDWKKVRKAFGFE